MLLIDGYNLLFASARRRLAREELPKAREDLIVRIARYCEIGGLRARIVFDFTQGPPVYGHASRRKLGAVELWFTPRGITADQEILGTVGATQDRTAYTVITSDRAIAEAVAKKQVTVQDSSTFSSEVERVLRNAEGKTDEAPQKDQGLGPGEVDYWLREFGFDDESRDR